MTDTIADMDVRPEEKPITETRDDSVVLPGDLAAKLKACREDAEMDLEQAAIEMRLSTTMLKALEAENFPNLPDPPYVRGYLRSYARLNGSDPKALIHTYELLRGADPDSFALPPTMPLNRVAKPGMSPGTLKLLGLAFLVLLLGILSMIPAVSQWASTTWQNFSAKTAETLPATTDPAQIVEIPRDNGTGQVAPNKPAPATPVATTTESLLAATTLATNGAAQPLADPNQDTPALVNTTGLPLDTTQEETDSISPDAELATDEAQNGPAADAQADSAANATAATPAGTAEATAATGDTASSTAAQATPEGAAPDTTAAAATTPPETTATTPASPPEGTAAATVGDTAARQQPIDGEVLVRMEFTQEVWMQVKDSNKKSIFETVSAANTWKQFKTRTPLSFKVGNAPGVRIYLNGQLFDQTPHTRGSVSRFTVD